ncbi:MAG: hypothetical protein IT290_08115 [Deltaproteobacteria bacterium]|nr:hypothetical protein [Deltaproteobacteria bacterium]
MSRGSSSPQSALAEGGWAHCRALLMNKLGWNTMNLISFRTRVALNGVLAGALCFGLTACNKQEKSGTVAQKVAAVVSDTDPLALSSTLADRLPPSAAGFYMLRISHPAFQRLQASDWKNENVLDFANVQPGSAESKVATSRLMLALRDAGFDLANEASWRSTLSEIAVFATPPVAVGDAQPQVGFGAIVSPQAGTDLNVKFVALKEALKKHQFPVVDETFGSVAGFSTTLRPEDIGGTGGEALPMFVGWTESFGVMSTQKDLASATLAAAPGSAPILKSPGMKQAAAQFGANAERYGVGYLDIATVLPAIAQAQPNVKPGEFPFQAAAFESAMGDTPRTAVSIVVEPKTPEQRELFASLGSATSAAILASVPESPMLFLSLEGTLIRNIQRLALGANPPTPGDPFALLNDVKRIALSGRVGAVGQSFLPIPDLVIAIETSSPQQTIDTLVSLASASLSASGPGGMMASDKEIAGVKAKSFMSPLGFAVNFAATDKLALISSSDAPMASAIQGSKSGTSTFLASLPAEGKSTLADGKTVANFYVNFPQIGSFMESMGGMLSMFGGQQPGQTGPKLTDPESIAAIKKKGTLLGAITYEGETLNLKSSFAKAPAA